MCFRALLYVVFHSIRIGFEGSELRIVDQKASDGRVSQSGFQFLRWLYSEHRKGIGNSTVGRAPCEHDRKEVEADTVQEVALHLDRRVVPFGSIDVRTDRRHGHHGNLMVHHLMVRYM